MKIAQRINTRIINTRRGFFKPQMFPNLRLISQIHESKKLFGGTGIRMCAGVDKGRGAEFCGSWQPYISPETLAWLPYMKLHYLKIMNLKGLDLRISHGICPTCFKVYEKQIDDMEKE